jgi:hypothetical protein
MPMSAVPLQSAANDDKAAIRIVPSRFVTIELASAMTGLSEGAIRMKIARGIWLEDRQFVRRDGRVMVDMKGYEQWAESGRA